MDNPWLDYPPAEPGFYEMRCMETDGQPSEVTVIFQRGEMWVRDPHVGTNLLKTYHYNLTGIQWRHAVHQVF